MNRNQLIILLHLVFWIQNFFRNIAFSWHYELTEIICDQMLIASLCYINYFYLFPYILKKNKLNYYLLWILVFVGGFTCIYTIWTFTLPYLFDVPDIKENWRIIAVSFNISFLYGAMSSGSRLAVDWTSNEKRNRELILQKTKSQIQNMKSNINIPFMLDTLSHAEALAIESPQQAAESIMALSNVLRYGLYESDLAMVNVEREIEVIRDYITLQNNVDTNVQLTLEISNLKTNTSVPPNILLRFISLWKTEFKNTSVGINFIHIEGGKNSLVLKIAIESEQEHLLQLKTQLFTFSNENFTVEYPNEDNYLCLKITNLTP